MSSPLSFVPVEYGVLQTQSAGLAVTCSAESKMDVGADETAVLFSTPLIKPDVPICRIRLSDERLALSRWSCQVAGGELLANG